MSYAIPKGTSFLGVVVQNMTRIRHPDLMVYWAGEDGAAEGKLYFIFASNKKSLLFHCNAPAREECSAAFMCELVRRYYGTSAVTRMVSRTIPRTRSDRKVAAARLAALLAPIEGTDPWWIPF